MFIPSDFEKASIVNGSDLLKQLNQFVLLEVHQAAVAEAQVAADNAKAYFAEVQAIMTESKDAVVKAATPKKA